MNRFALSFGSLTERYTQHYIVTMIILKVCSIVSLYSISSGLQSGLVCNISLHKNAV